MGWEEDEKKEPSNEALDGNIAKELVEKLQGGQAMVVRKDMDKIDVIEVTEAEKEAMLAMLEAMRKAQKESLK